MSDLFEVLCAIIVIVAVVGSLLLFAGNIIVGKQCSNYTEMTGKTTKYLFCDSCYVETGEGWQRWDEYKARATASELSTAN